MSRFPARASGETLEGIAKVLAAFFEHSPKKSVSEIVEHVGKHGADDILEGLRKVGAGDIAKAMEDDVAKAMQKELGQVSKGGPKALQETVETFGKDLEAWARKGIDDAASKGAVVGGESWLDRTLKLHGLELDPKWLKETADGDWVQITDKANWHGHHVPFKDIQSNPALLERTRDVQMLLAKNGIDPVFGKEVLMVAWNQGHSKTMRELILKELNEGFAKGGREGLLEALEHAKSRFVPPYPKVTPIPR